MDSEADRALLSRLIKEAQEEIRSDGKVAGGRFQEFFDHIAGELTDPELSVTKAKTKAGLGGNYASKFFDLTGRHPKEYLDYKRVRLAQKIFQRVDVYVYVIAFAVGFTEQGSFTRTYSRLLGHPPKEDQKRKRTKAESKQSDPRLNTNTAEINAGSTSLNMIRFWNAIRNMNTRNITDYLRAHVDRLELDHFRFLLEKAKFMGRMERDKGEALVHIALKALKLVEFRDGKEYRNEKILGYAYLANACRRRFDIDGARDWFKEVDGFVITDPALACKVELFRAAMYWWAGDAEKAIDLIHRITPRVRQHGSPELLARSLIVGADIYESTGNPVQALPLLSEALELRDHIDDPYVVFTIYYNLTHLYTRMGDESKASALFRVVSVKFEDVSDQVPAPYVSYLEGALCRITLRYTKSESLLVSAQNEFLKCGFDIYAAIVGLELSLLYLEKKDHAKAFETVSAIFPILSQSCSVHQEAMAALAILQESVAQQCVSKQALKKALKKLDLVRKDPTFQFRELPGKGTALPGPSDLSSSVEV